MSQGPGAAPTLDTLSNPRHPVPPSSNLANSVQAQRYSSLAELRWHEILWFLPTSPIKVGAPSTYNPALTGAVGAKPHAGV
jgi:hypothetical protein